MNDLWGFLDQQPNLRKRFMKKLSKDIPLMDS